MRLLTLLPVIPILSVISQRSQFDVDCPPLCRCNKTSIECINTNSNGISIFSNIRPEAYPELDTIIVTGNNIGDISGTNIFGDKVKHRYVSLLNFTSNNITSFDSDTFGALPALEYLYLTDNKIENIASDPFRWNSRLRVLDISNIFSKSINEVQRASILSKMFVGSSNNFVTLQEIIIRNNDLETVLSETFCNIQGLVRLHISRNKLKTFNFNDGCIPNLELLDLSDNQIITMSNQLWEGLPSLSTVDISSNPLQCDCNLAPFIERIAKNPSASLNQGRTICASPPFRRGQNAFDITDFNCSSNHRLLIFLILIIIICSSFILIRKYRNRLRLIRLPFVAGYTKLGDTENTATTSPQFV